MIRKMMCEIFKVLLLAGMALWGTTASALTTSLQSPTTCTNVSIGTNATWSNPARAQTSDDSYATATVDGTTTDYLVCTGYGFDTLAIPDDAIINGITVYVERKSSRTSDGGSNDARMRLVKANVIGAADRSTSTTYTTSDQVEAHGGAADSWGTTWTLADIRNANFGAAFAATKPSSANNSHVISVDQIQISVDYSIPAMTCAPPSNAPAGVTLSCVCDNFGRSALNPSTIYGSNWTVSTSDTTGIVPSIVNPGYLRLTYNTGNNAKAVTVPGIFPAAGNYISVEFQHFAYNGTATGADGIAVTLSDYSVAPVPGAFGGSLGYAQKTGTACTSSGATICPGFAGGWIGIGIDEWGNYQYGPASGGEGRIGGPGQIAQSVAVRGSGSGTDGYNWIGGTSSQTPTIDDSSSKQPSPGDYFQVIVDARDATAASVVVNRDTGAGYNSLINIPNIFTAASGQGFTQAAVPDNWQISFTGSTGGANNIHEIGGLKVCAQTVQPPSGGTASGFGIIDEAYGTPQSIAVQKYLTGRIYTKLMGVPFNLNVAALSNSQVQTTYGIAAPGKNVTLKLVDNTDGACILDSSQANYCNSTCTAKSAVAGGIQTLNFGSTDKGEKKFGSFTLNSAYKNLVAIASDGTTAACSIDAFSVRPTGLTLAVTNPAGTATLKAGSDNFTVTATVAGVAGNANKYTGNLKLKAQPVSPATVSGTFSPVALPTATSGTPNSTASRTNFTYSEVGDIVFPFAAGSTSPRGVYDGVETAYECINGVTVAQCDALRAATWTGVDSITSKSDCVANSYSNTINSDGKYGCNFGNTAAVSFGRFVPARFSMYSNGITPRSDFGNNGAGCTPASTFTYMGEPFRISFVISARDGSGNVTKNYAGTLAKLMPPDAASWIAYNTSGANTMGLWGIATGYPVGTGTCKAIFTNATPGITNFSCAGVTAPASKSRAAGPRISIFGTPSSPTWVNGIATFTADVVLERADTPDGAYDTLNIGIAPRDSDGVLLSPAYDVDTDNNGTAERGTVGSTVVRYGVLRIDNAYGSEQLDLPVKAQAQYWNGSAYVTNADDSCTVLSGDNLEFRNKTGGLASATVNLLSGATLNGGSGSLLVSKPTVSGSPPTSKGSVDLGAITTYYLPGTGKLTFGGYKNNQVIYLREIY